MIKVNVKRENGIVTNVTLVGHAKYADYGKDIVCAAASSIVITSVNAVLKYNKDAISYVQDDDLNITIKLHDNVVDLLINNMLDLLTELEEQYKKNIKINNI